MRVSVALSLAWQVVTLYAIQCSMCKYTLLSGRTFESTFKLVEVIAKILFECV